MKVRCPKCGASWELAGRLGFREECPECAAFLHTCTNCRHYEPATRGCQLPDTEEVRDRESMNFCEEFEFNQAPPSPREPSAGGKSQVPPEEARRRFEDLFQEPPE